MKNSLMILLSLLLACEVSAQENKFYRQGYVGDVEMSVKAALQKEVYADFFSVYTMHGYAFGDGAFIGAGLGVKLLERANKYNFDIPVFVQADYHFLDKQFSPFVALRSGVQFSPDSTGTFTVFINPRIGVDLGRFYAQLGYNLHSGHQSVMVGRSTSVEYYRLHQLEAGFGFRF